MHKMILMISLLWALPTITSSSSTTDIATKKHSFRFNSHRYNSHNASAWINEKKENQKSQDARDKTSHRAQSAIQPNQTPQAKLTPGSAAWAAAKNKKS